MKIWFLATLFLLSSCTTVNAGEVFPLGRLQLAELTIEVQLAATPALRAQGLMFQETAEPGMLLLYSEPQHISLWMRNTSMPLDVAFIDANWSIHSIKPLAPFDETPVPSGTAVIAALEMPRGWFAANQLTVGTSVRLLD